MELTPYTPLIARMGQELAEMFLSQESHLTERACLLDADIATLLRAVGCEAMRQVYAGVTAQEVACCHQKGMTIHRNPTIAYHVIFGTISLSSPYLWKAGESANPVRERLGLTHHGRSETVNRALSAFGSEASFAQAAAHFEEHYHYALHRSTVDRVTKEVAQDALAFLETRLTEVPDLADPPPAGSAPGEPMLIELDGCQIRTGKLALVWPELVADGAEAKASCAQTNTSPAEPLMGPPQRKKPIVWKEVRMGLARPLTAKKKRYVGRVSPGYTEVVRDLHQLALQEGLQQEDPVVAVADGGMGLREALERAFPTKHFQFILDVRHLTGHLYATAEALKLPTSEQAAWVATWLELLSEGAIRYTLEALTTLFQQTGEHRVEQLVGYLERFWDATNYDDFRARGYPIGSGEIESAHKSVPQHRLKLPGACWHPNSLNPMVSLRIVRANDWWNEFWEDRTTRRRAA